MLLSIIIPFEHFDKLLLRLVNSLLPQLNEKVEIILVGDGLSEIDYLEISGHFTNSHIKLYKIKKSGANKARQYGVLQSLGEYITFGDSDDRFTPTAISTFLEIIHHIEPDLIVANRIRIELNQSTSQYTYERVNLLVQKPTLTKKEITTFPACVYAKAVKRKHITDLDFDTSSIHQDLNITAKVLKNIQTLYFTNSVVYEYIIRKGSISNAGSLNKEAYTNSTYALDGFALYYSRFKLSSVEKKYLYYTLFKYYQRLIINSRNLKNIHLVLELRNKFKHQIQLTFVLTLLFSYPKYFLLSLIYLNKRLFLFYFSYTIKKNKA